MFDIIPTRMLILALVAVVLIGPKDLPRVMRVVGQWVGKGRAMARHFRSAVDDMIRESELQEMEQKWKAENERIMREHSEMMSAVTASVSTTPTAAALPAPSPPPAPEPSAEAHAPEAHPVAESLTAPADSQRQG